MTKKLFIIFLVLSCNLGKNEIPGNILPKNKMIPILIDIHIAEASVQENGVVGDSAIQKAKDYYAYIYKLHDVTAEQFEVSFDYYCRNLSLMNEIYDKMIEELSKKEGQHFSREDLKGEITNLRKRPFSVK